MSYVETLRGFRWETAWLVVMGFIPYFDLETVGVVPVLRDVVPYVDPIHVLDLSWTERTRLGLLIVVPIIDGEWIKLFFGADVNEVISD